MDKISEMTSTAERNLSKGDNFSAGPPASSSALGTTNQLGRVPAAVNETPGYHEVLNNFSPSGMRTREEDGLPRKMSLESSLVSQYSRLSKKRRCDLIRTRAQSQGYVLPSPMVVNAALVNSVEEETLIQDTLSQDYFADLSLADASRHSTVQIVTYKRRFYILFIFSFLMWFTCMQWSAWGPISDSIFAVFPDWNPSTVAMMENWVSLMFICCVLPVCWMTERIGLRSGIVLSSLLFAFGLSLRCVTNESPTFTILCHVCYVMMGLSITLVLSAPPMIASTWFPPNERTSVVAFIMAIGQLGSVGSYLEPLVVRAPAPNIPTKLIKWDIMLLMYAGAGVALLLLLSIFIYFPSKPPLPPSFTSSTERLYFKSSLSNILRNRNFLAITFIYGMATGPSLAWIGVLNFSLKPLGFNQDDMMYVGLSAALSCFAMSISAGWLTDLVYGYVKQTIIALLLAASFSYYWFLLLSTNMLSLIRWQVYASISLGLSFNYSTIALFYELAVEAAFPVPEVLIGGILTAFDSIFSALFFLVYFFDTAEFVWVCYVLVASNAFPILAMFFIKTDYTRYTLDSPKLPSRSEEEA